MIKQIVIVDDVPVLQDFRTVAVESYGSEGCKPIYADDCMYKTDVACISGSGDSICGGYFGHSGKHVILCQEKDTK